MRFFNVAFNLFLILINVIYSFKNLHHRSLISRGCIIPAPGSINYQSISAIKIDEPPEKPRIQFSLDPTFPLQIVVGSIILYFLFTQNSILLTQGEKLSTNNEMLKTLTTDLRTVKDNQTYISTSVAIALAFFAGGNQLAEFILNSRKVIKGDKKEEEKITKNKF